MISIKMLWIIPGYLALGLLGWFGGCVLLSFLGLTIIFWRESIIARIYYGIPTLLVIGLIIIGLTYIFSGNIVESDLNIYLALYAGLVLSLISAYIFRHMVKYKSSNLKKEYHDRYPLAHKLAQVSGCISVLLLFSIEIFEFRPRYLVHVALFLCLVSFMFVALRKVSIKLFHDG